jgi:hypothetical protein
MVNYMNPGNSCVNTTAATIQIARNAKEVKIAPVISVGHPHCKIFFVSDEMRIKNI